VRAEHAFESPETLSSFTTFCRQHGEHLNAIACVAVVPTPAVAFPQVGRGGSGAGGGGRRRGWALRWLGSALLLL
jgi:hypothetical protein